MVLIIWFVRRRGLTGRDDPLDPHTLVQKQLGDDLPGCPSGKVIEQIDHGRALLHPLQPHQVTAAAPVPAGPTARLFPKPSTLPRPSCPLVACTFRSACLFTGLSQDKQSTYAQCGFVAFETVGDIGAQREPIVGYLPTQRAD